MMKSIIDITITLILLFLLWPILVLVSIWIKFDSNGPVIFKQERIGLNGESFYIYKFRTMVVDAQSLGGYSTQRGDVRITRAGRLLRKTSLDEVPQLLNVLKGEMSCVGPRPNVPQQKERYTEMQWKKRTQVKPGITGLAQATNRSEGTAEERIRLDLEYVDKISVLQDLKIILMTIKQLIFKGSF